MAMKMTRDSPLAQLEKRLLHAIDKTARVESTDVSVAEEETDLSDEETRSYLISAGFDLEDIERRRLARLRQWELERIENSQDVDFSSDSLPGVEILRDAVVRVSAEAIEWLRDHLMPSMPELVPARRSVASASEPPVRTRIEDALVAKGVIVIPVGWEPKGKGKAEFMLYSVADLPSESISTKVTINDQPVTVSAWDQSKKHRLIYLTLDVEPVKLASCEVMLENGALTIKLQTKA